MGSSLRKNDGFLLIELLVATVVLAIAILALMAVYDSAFLSLHKAAQKTAASTLAANQLELYSASTYANIGLDSTSLTAAKSNATYNSDEAGLTVPTATDGTAATVADVALASACSTTQCLPIQTLTGSDHHSYTVETFIRDVTGAAYGTATSGRAERIVTVVVRDPNTTGTPVVAQMTSAYDAING
jgi:Tfp pilus assembly protein PilV